jgi:hypothetical protein
LKCPIFGSDVNAVSAEWVNYQSIRKLTSKSREHTYQILCPHLDIVKAEGDVHSIPTARSWVVNPAPLVFARMLIAGELVFDCLEGFH